MTNKKGKIELQAMGMVALFIVVMMVAFYFLWRSSLVPDAQIQQQSHQDNQANPVGQSPTAGWQLLQDNTLGFSMKYPAGFFDPQQAPQILTGPCNAPGFPPVCPVIESVIAKDQNATSTYIHNQNNTAVKTINGNPYCLTIAQDAAVGHVYRYYYYATVKGGQCLVVYFGTSTTNCDFYLPLEQGNAEQEKNYRNCLATNEEQPKMLSQIVDTFTFAR